VAKPLISFRFYLYDQDGGQEVTPSQENNKIFCCANRQKVPIFFRFFAWENLVHSLLKVIPTLTSKTLQNGLENGQKSIFVCRIFITFCVFVQ
jgi:hypothetical protein